MKKSALEMRRILLNEFNQLENKFVSFNNMHLSMPKEIRSQQPYYKLKLDNTAAQILLILYNNRNNGPMSIGEISIKGLYTQIVCNPIKELAQKGLIRRFQKPDNRKNIYAEIVEYGIQIFEENRRITEAYIFNKLFGSVTIDKVKRLVESMCFRVELLLRLCPVEFGQPDRLSINDADNKIDKNSLFKDFMHLSKILANIHNSLICNVHGLPLAKLGASSTQSNVLYVLNFYGKGLPMSLSEISRHEGLYRQIVGKAVKGLEKLELIRSFQKPDNKKNVYIEFTPVGRQIINESDRMIDESLMSRLSGAFTVSEMKKINDALCYYIEFFSCLENVSS